MMPIAKGALVEVGDIPVEDGNGGLYRYKCAAVIVFDTPEDLRKAIRHGAIEAKYRVGGDVSRED